ncbi:hypothetical protein ACO1O0_000646 [Amphichorda felina]
MDRQDRDKTPKKGFWSSLAKPFKKTPKERPELPWGSNYVPADPYRPHGPQLAPRPTTAPGFSYFREPRRHGANVRPGDATRVPEKQERASITVAWVRARCPSLELMMGTRAMLITALRVALRKAPKKVPKGVLRGPGFPRTRKGFLAMPGTQLPEVQEWVRSYTKGPQSSPRDDLKLPQDQERVRRDLRAALKPPPSFLKFKNGSADILTSRAGTRRRRPDLAQTTTRTATRTHLLTFHGMDSWKRTGLKTKVLGVVIPGKQAGPSLPLPNGDEVVLSLKRRAWNPPWDGLID